MWVDRYGRPAPRWKGWTMLATYASTGLVLVGNAVSWYACATKEQDGNLPLLSMVLPLLPTAFMLVKVERWGLTKVSGAYRCQPSPECGSAQGHDADLVDAFPSLLDIGV